MSVDLDSLKLALMNFSAVFTRGSEDIMVECNLLSNQTPKTVWGCESY